MDFYNDLIDYLDSIEWLLAIAVFCLVIITIIAILFFAITLRFYFFGGA